MMPLKQCTWSHKTSLYFLNHHQHPPVAFLLWEMKFCCAHFMQIITGTESRLQDTDSHIQKPSLHKSRCAGCAWQMQGCISKRFQNVSYPGDLNLVYNVPGWKRRTVSFFFFFFHIFTITCPCISAFSFCRKLYFLLLPTKSLPPDPFGSVTEKGDTPVPLGRTHLTVSCGCFFHYLMNHRLRASQPWDCRGWEHTEGL